MTRNTNGKLVKDTIRLWAADVEYIKKHYPDNYNAQIRRIVGNWVIRNRNKVEVKDEA